MTTPSGIFFSYLLGLIFTVGGLLFIIFLDENNLLYGIPYLVIGLLLIGGVWSAVRRKRRHEAEQAAAGAGEEDGPPAVTS